MSWLVWLLSFVLRSLLVTVKRGKESFSGYNKPKRTPGHPKEVSCGVG